MPDRLARLSVLSVSRPFALIVSALLLCLVAGAYTARHFAINTDTARLISVSAPWRQAEIAFDRDFPGKVDLIVAVIDAATPETADAAAGRLSTDLSASGIFRSVRRPDSGAFFEKNGLLFLPKEEFRTTLSGIIRQQPALAVLAADPSLGGVIETITLGLRGVAAGEIALADLVRPMTAIAALIDKSAGGPVEPLSWRTLLADGAPSRLDLRRLVLIQPRLDYSALQPGAAAIDHLRARARALGLTPDNGIRVRLTGTVPLADEEFSTVAEGAAFNTLGTLLVVLGLLFAALRSWQIVLAVMATLLAGLITTAGLGLALVGQYNLISVAFAVLFVGLGVDFSIQLAVRYREIRHREADLGAAIRLACIEIQRPLLLAAASTAVGFFAFLPTSYRGVSELGLIAGFGMLIAFIASMVLLPALLAVLRPPAEPSPVSYRGLAGADHFIERHRRAILAVTGIIFLAGLPLFAVLKFDSNPMNLRNRVVESVATFYDLARDLETSPHAIDVVAASPAAAEALAEKLATLPEVARVYGLHTFLPKDADWRLSALSDAALLMDTVLDPIAVKPRRPAGDYAEDLSKAAIALRAAAAQAGLAAPPGQAAERLAQAFDALAHAPASRIGAVEEALTGGIPLLLERLRAAFSAEAVAPADLPAELRADWLTPDGRARIEVIPRGDAGDDAVMRRFVAAVRMIAPEATGAPITIVESGKTVVESFITAAIVALVAITLLLLVVLRRVFDVFVTLVPLVVAVMMSLEAAVLLGIPLNFANIIALPLMCGVSVAFHIYFVLAWRAGSRDVLASSLTRAILFSALTTATAFGSLWLSSHPGTSSMGQLLTISLFFTLLAAFVFVPAFLGPPEAPGD